MATKKSTGKQWLMAALKVCVAVAILYWLISSGKFDPSSLKKIGRLEVWLAGAGMFLLGLGINTLRWKSLLEFENVSLGFLDAYRLSLIGIFFNFVIPGGVGGDVVKVGYLFQRYPHQKIFVGWATLMDRFFGVGSLLTYAAIVGTLFHERLGADVGPSISLLSDIIIAGAVSGAIFVVFGPKKKIRNALQGYEKLYRLIAPALQYLSRPKKIIKPLLLSFIGQFFMISIVAVLGTLLGETFPWYIYFMLVPLGILTTIVPIAPAGLGVGQAAYFFLFETVVGNGEFGVLAITFLQAVQFLVGLLGGILFVLYDKKTESPVHG